MAATRKFTPIQMALGVLGVIAVISLVMILLDGSGVVPGDDGVLPSAGREPAAGAGSTDLAALPWAMYILIATIVLGVILAIVQVRSTRLTAAEEARSEAGARALHERQRNDPNFPD